MGSKKKATRHLKTLKELKEMRKPRRPRALVWHIIDNRTGQIKGLAFDVDDQVNVPDYKRLRRWLDRCIAYLEARK